MGVASNLFSMTRVNGNNVLPLAKICRRTVLSGPALSASIIIGYYRMYLWRANAGRDLAHAQDDVNRHIMSMLEDTIFALRGLFNQFIWQTRTSVEFASLLPVVNIHLKSEHALFYNKTAV